MSEPTTQTLCPEEAVLRSFAGGRLSPPAAKLVQLHLDGCPACARRVEALRLDSGSRPTEIADLRDTGAGAPRPLKPASPFGERDGLGRGNTVGRYLVLEKLGQGSMGVVYAAYDPELDRRIALKLLRLSGAGQVDSALARARLLREAHAMAKLSHPNVVAVYDAGTLDDRVFMAMELVEGITLRRWLNEQQRSWREVVAMFTAAGRGLAAAHAAGLVHRDFKPDNVLLGKDGRIRVTDFGLVRTAGEGGGAEPVPLSSLSDAPVPENGPLATPLTRADVVMGTPGYMAPEQYLARPADARTDQFSFCISLYEGLYGERPFAGWTMAEIAAATVHGRLREEPKSARVPGHLRQLLLRGLQTKPEDRFPSMDALLEALGRDPSVTRRRLAVLGGAVVLGAATVLVGLSAAREQSLLCKGAERKLEGVWDPAVKARAEQAFRATGKPYAEAAFRGVSTLLDTFTASWARMHTEACEATRLRGDQSESIMTLRMACLDARLREVRALADLFASADGEVVQRSVDAATRLSSLKGCADTEALTSQVSPPSSLAERARVEVLRTRLAEAKALSGAGRYKAALEMAAPAAAEAKSLKYLPLEAEALARLGEIQLYAGDFTAAEQSLQRAVLAGIEGKADSMAARAAAELVFVVGYVQARYAEGEQWARFAEASIGRLGGDDEMTGVLKGMVAAVLREQNKLEEARTQDEEGLALQLKVYGPDHPVVARTYNGLGVLYERMHRMDKARVAYETALRIQEKVLGPSHPDVAMTLNNSAGIYEEDRRYDQAYQRYMQALGIFEAAFGPQHGYVGIALSNVGGSLASLGRYREALGYDERALALLEKAYAADHPRVIAPLEGIGKCRTALGDPRAALPPLERALVLAEKVPGGHALLPTVELSLANALWSSGKDRARAKRLVADAARRDVSARDREELQAWLASHR